MVIMLLGCGGAVPTLEEPEAATPSTSSPPASEEPPPAMQVEGILGTLSRDEVQRGIDRRMSRFIACFSQRYDALEVLGGEIELAFRINVEGGVRWVRASRSTLGDRATERCLVSAAEGARFRPPRGGEAEFSFPLHMQPPDDVRPAVSWPASRVDAALSRYGRDLLASCRPPGAGGGYQVTAYVARPGRVIAVGVTADDAALDESYDCVVEQVTSWELPSPGSYPARVSFEVQ